MSAWPSPPCHKDCQGKKPDLDGNAIRNLSPLSNLPFVSKKFEVFFHCSLIFNSAAFEYLDHAILSDDLRPFLGVLAIALSWFDIHLTDRIQSVMVAGFVSTPTTFDFGVLQWSALGPSLFTPVQWIPSHALVPLIRRTVNESLLCGSVPLQFKEAVVPPPPHPPAPTLRPLWGNNGLDANSFKNNLYVTPTQGASWTLINAHTKTGMMLVVHQCLSVLWTASLQIYCYDWHSFSEHCYVPRSTYWLDIVNKTRLQ